MVPPQLMPLQSVHASSNMYSQACGKLQDKEPSKQAL